MKVVLLTEAGANAIRGSYGKFSAIDPVKLPDGQYMIPARCMTDPDLADALEAIQTNMQDHTEILPLPEQGEECVAGFLYQWDDPNQTFDDEPLSNVIKCIQTHNRTEHDPRTIPALFSFFRVNADDLEWIENEFVEVGWKRVYEGNTYTVIQAHQTLPGWTPDVVPALWSLDVAPSEDWQVGVSYAVGDEVTYEGTLYRCLQAHTSIAGWQPPNVPALWQVI